MTGHWFFHSPLRLGEAVLNAEESRHALGSHRLHSDDELVLFDGAGQVAQATLAAAADRGPRKHHAGDARVQVKQVATFPRPRRRLSLIVPACKGPRLPWMIEKCTELGVDRISLTVFERSVVDPAESRLEKLRKIAIEACKQSHRAWLPELAMGLPLSSALAADRTPFGSGAGGRIYLADPSPDARLAFDVLASISAAAAAPSDAPDEHVTVIIGPEGGLTPAEIERVIAAGAERICLGAHILRVETAAIAAAALWAAADVNVASGSRAGRGTPENDRFLPTSDEEPASGSNL